MINHWFITGDTHGPQTLYHRLMDLQNDYPELYPEETGVIILGDAGLNYLNDFFGKDQDAGSKLTINKLNFQLYILRGNHEFRPSTLPDISYLYDYNVNGYVYVEPDFPNIHYFSDGGNYYTINDNTVFTIPGAYSIDKYFRLSTGYKWFRDEQLTAEEKFTLFEKFSNVYDVTEQLPTILSHTCPKMWEKYIKDLFLEDINQSIIDKSTEEYLDKIYNAFFYRHWYFGHFHDDRDIREMRATMLYNTIIPFGQYINERDWLNE